MYPDFHVGLNWCGVFYWPDALPVTKPSISSDNNRLLSIEVCKVTRELVEIPQSNNVGISSVIKSQLKMSRSDMI